MPESPQHKTHPHPAKREEPLAPVRTRGGDAPAHADTAAHPYAELQAVSNFSFLRGASHPDELVVRAAEAGCSAFALTDVNTLAGVVRAHAAAKEVGIPFVLGCRLELGRESLAVLVYPTSRESYGRLCRLLTLGKRRTEKGECDLALADLLGHQEGLLAVAVPPGPGAPEERRQEFERSLARLREAFTDDRLSLAASALFGPDDDEHLVSLADLSERARVPLVATNDVHYHLPHRRSLQDCLVCIRHICTIHEAGRRLFPNGERYLKGPQEMARLFARYPRALARTVEIAERASAFSLDQLRYEYPEEVCPNGRSAMAYLRELTWKGAGERLAQEARRDAHTEARSEGESKQSLDRPPPSPHAVPWSLRASVPYPLIQRLEHEFEIIESLGYAKYFLTVRDIVCFARSKGILCQGRGAAANSAVCYCLGITAVDPTRVDMLFERFVSKERNEPPDIDIDFEHERREEVIQYIYGKYGRDRAALCAEVISYRGRSAVRDVGKAMGLSLDLVDQLARQLDWWDGGAVAEERLRELGLDPSDPTLRMVLELCNEILGFPRHLSQHVGGFVITQGKLEETVPIENAAMPDRTVIEWDKDDIDAMGMLKVDCLGLGMLTAISKALALVNHEFGAGAKSLELHTIPPEDPAVYEMIGHADTVGIFQVESRAQMSMLPRLKPRNYYDLVIEVAIVRPGPIQGDMVHPYLRRRQGIDPVSYPSPEVESVLSRTLGVPLFQEQAMQLAVVAGGFTPGEADQLRRAIAAWKRAGNKIKEFGRKLREGMIRNGYTPKYADQVFTQIQGFSGYGFPESHAASFALLVYASAWLKRYHPAAFTAALLNSQPMGFYAPAQLVRDAREHGVEARDVDVNFSGWDCRLESELRPPSGRDSEGGPFPGACSQSLAAPLATIVRPPGEEDQPAFLPPHLYGAGGPALRLGMRLVQNLGEAPARAIEEAVKARGPFRTITDLWRAARIPVASLRALARADAFRSMGLDRRAALWEIRDLRDERLPLFEGETGTSDIRHLAESPGRPTSDIALPPLAEDRHVLQDYATLGLSLRAHPVSFLRAQLDAAGVTPHAVLKDENAMPHGTEIAVAGLVLCRQRPGTASGIVFMTLEDETGIANLVVRPQVYERHRPAARHSACLLVRGHVERQGEVVHILVREMEPLQPSTTREKLVVESRDFH